MTAAGLFDQACALCQQGQAAQAARLLRAGILEGLWWRPDLLDDEPDLAALRAEAEFADIRAACQVGFAAEQARARPQLLVISPATATWEPRTLLVIHWWGDTAAAFAERWRPLVDEGWTLAVPQSSQMCCAGGYCWDDPGQARSELRQHLEDCSTRRGLSPDGMVIAGSSQGAPLAMELAHEAGMPWLCVVPFFPEGYDVSTFLGVPGHTWGAFLLGEHDPANAGTRAVMRSLDGAGVRWIQGTLKDVGHDIPDGFAAEAAELLRRLKAVQ